MFSTMLNIIICAINRTIMFRASNIDICDAILMFQFVELARNMLNYDFCNVTLLFNITEKEIYFYI